ncbi:MAG: hypothetical protein LUG24_05350 [Clostridiales bacterium]|nr:hypothetical protein [Clostridiales bacterium]
MNGKNENITLEKCIELAADNYFDEIEKRAAEGSMEFSEKHTKEIEEIIKNSKGFPNKKAPLIINKRIAFIFIAAAIALTVLTAAAEDYNINFPNLYLYINKDEEETTEEITEETTAAEYTEEPLTEAPAEALAETEAEEPLYAESEESGSRILIESLNTEEAAEGFKREIEYNYEILEKMGIEFTQDSFIGTPFTWVIQQETLTEKIEESYMYCFPIIENGTVIGGFTFNCDTGRVNGLLTDSVINDGGTNINSLTDGKIYSLITDSDNNEAAFSEGEIFYFGEEVCNGEIYIKPPYEETETSVVDILKPLELSE